MKGIIIAGGAGSRLFPLTAKTSKQLLMVYDKPMILYPLSTLCGAGIKDILIVTTPRDLTDFQKLLGDGSRYGIRLSYTVQQKPGGIVQALLLGEEFIGGESCAVALGDNIFYGEEWKELLLKAIENSSKGKATVFGCYVKDPERFGVVEFDDHGQVISLEEKPQNPKSNYCITGLYIYDNRVMEVAKNVKLSERGEFEITDLNRMYLEADSLCVQIPDKNAVWMDVGTIESLEAASNFMRAVNK